MLVQKMIRTNFSTRFPCSLIYSTHAFAGNDNIFLISNGTNTLYMLIIYYFLVAVDPNQIDSADLNLFFQITDISAAMSKIKHTVYSAVMVHPVQYKILSQYEES